MADDEKLEIQPTDAQDASEETQLTTSEETQAAVSATEQMPLQTLATASDASDEDAEVQLALKNLKARRAAKKRRKRLRIAGACAVAVALIGGLFAFRALNGGGEANEVEPVIAEVERGHYSNDISASGKLKAGSTVVVTPEVDGIIETLSVAEGQDVKEGDVLFTIKNEALDRAVRDAEQEVKSAEQGLSAAQNSVRQAQEARDAVWSRYEEAWGKADALHSEWEYLLNNYDTLYAEWANAKAIADAYTVKTPPQYPGDAPSVPVDDPKYREWEKAYEDYMERLEEFNRYQDALAQVPEEPKEAGTEPAYPETPDDSSLVAAIESAEASVRTAELALQKAREAHGDAVKQADKRNVKAPISGSVMAVGAKVGQAVGSAAGATASQNSSTTPLVQISDVDKMAIDVEVNEVDIMTVKTGQKATVSFSAIPDLEVAARVTEVATVATGSAGESGAAGGGVVTFHVGLVIDDPDPQLRAGMTANVKIHTVELDNVLIVPSAALNGDVPSATVEVVKDEESVATEMRTVRVSQKGAEQAVVDEGLSEGEKVLVNAAEYREAHSDAQSA